MKVKESYFRRI